MDISILFSNKEVLGRKFTALKNQCNEIKTNTNLDDSSGQTVEKIKELQTLLNETSSALSELINNTWLFVESASGEFSEADQGIASDIFKIGGTIR